MMRQKYSDSRALFHGQLLNRNQAPKQHFGITRGCKIDELICWLRGDWFALKVVSVNDGDCKVCPTKCIANVVLLY